MTTVVGDPVHSRRLVLASVLVGTFLGTLNNSVANIAVVDLIDDLRADLDAAVWFITGYVLAFAVLMPAAGRLIDAFGVRRVYLAGLGGFAVTSALVAMASNLPLVIAARVAQGIVNAPVLPAVMLTVVTAVPPEERGRAMGLWASVNGAAIAAGPPLGGVLAEAFGWRAIFWLDVPMALGALALAHRYLPDTESRRRGSLDGLGGGLLTLGLVAIMFALSQGTPWGWSKVQVWGLLATGLITLAAAWLRARSVADPFLDLDVLRNRHFAVLASVAALQMGVLFSVLFTVPLLLVSVFERSIGAAGAIVFALPITMVVAGPWAGSLSHHRGARALTTWGTALLAVAAVVMAAATQTQSLPLVTAGLVVLGAGVSAVQSPTAARIAEEVDEANRGVALGLFHTIRFLAGVLGTAAAAAVFASITGGLTPAALADGSVTRAFVADFALAAAVAVVALLLTRHIPDRAGERLAAVEVA